MKLHRRSVIDPRMPFWGRPVVRGTMLARGVLFRPVPAAVGALTWNPMAENPALRTPTAGATYTRLYEGPCRIQPNQDWRARSVNVVSETIVQHTTRIQLDLRENTLNDGEFPLVQINDIFRVTEVLELRGVPVDPQLTDLIHVVHNFVPTANTWARTLLCETDMTKVGVPLA